MSSWKSPKQPRNLNDTGGSVLPIFAMSLAALTSVTGFAVDYSHAQTVKTRMQAALDAAVLAGAAEAVASREDVASSVFWAAFSEQDLGQAMPSFQTLADGGFSGSITAEVDTYFSALVGFSSFELEIESFAGLAPGSAVSSTESTCLLVLDPSASQALLVNSGANVEAAGCEAHVKTIATPAAIFNSGSAINVSRLCVEGSNVINNGGAHSNLETACSTVADPFAGSLPEPASSVCDHNHGNFNGGSVVLSPGVYCGWFNFNSATSVSFEPGVYVIKNGGWNVNGGNWTGEGVTFYFADQSKIQFNSAVSAELSAPEDGDYSGIVFFEAQGLAKSDFVFNDSNDFNLEGLVYLPSRNVTFNSGSNVHSKNMTLVTNRLILNNTRWNLASAGKTIETVVAQAGSKHWVLAK